MNESQRAPTAIAAIDARAPCKLSQVPRAVSSWAPRAFLAAVKPGKRGGAQHLRDLRFLVRAGAARGCPEKRRRESWLPLTPAAPTRVCRKLPRVPRALAARPLRGRRDGNRRKLE